MGQRETRRIAIQDYLEIEREDRVRYEYHDGQLFRMAGGTVAHSTICLNISAELRGRLRAKGVDCIAFNSEMKIETVRNRKYVYPDAGLACPKFIESKFITGAITNPQVIVEVTSKESADYDRGSKFRQYFSLPTLQEYLIVDQDQPVVTIYRRHGESNLFGWESVEGLETAITLHSVDLELPLADIYANVEFATDDTSALPPPSA